MRVICFAVSLFLFSSLCDGQFRQANVEISGFSCRPLSIFRYECNLCQCNLFGSSAQCIPVECSVQIPEPETTPKKKPAKLCKPGQKKLEGCNECVCTASLLWACTNQDCKRPGNAIGSTKKSERKYSYECYKTIDRAFWVCESRTTFCGKYLLNINRIFFFEPRYIEIDSFCMKPSCALVEVRQAVKFACPEGEDTLELDDSEAEVIPVTTTPIPEVETPTTIKNMETTVESVETSPSDVASTPRADEPSEEPTTTTNNPEDIDASVEMVTTTEPVSEDTTIADINNSGEVPRDVIEDSGDSFIQEEVDSEEFRCKPNMSFKLECNTCWCKADGKGARYCTRIECLSRISVPLIQQ